MSWNGGIAPPFLTSALDGVEWSASNNGRFTWWERGSGSHWIWAGWAPEPVWTVCSTENSLASARNRTPVVHPIAHHYTDSADE
jgi:hypothetical protein